MDNQANKQTEGKLRYDLVCPFALEQLVKVLTYGAKKYDKSDTDVNYKKFHSYKKLYAATMRHIQQWMIEKESGDDGLDPETGLSHLTHAFACLHIMIHQETHNKFIEDNE